VENSTYHIGYRELSDVTDCVGARDNFYQCDSHKKLSVLQNGFHFSRRHGQQLAHVSIVQAPYQPHLHYQPYL